jgi:hypothetical protein
VSKRESRIREIPVPDLWPLIRDRMSASETKFRRKTRIRRIGTIIVATVVAGVGFSLVVESFRSTDPKRAAASSPGSPPPSSTSASNVGEISLPGPAYSIVSTTEVIWTSTGSKALALSAKTGDVLANVDLGAPIVTFSPDAAGAWVLTSDQKISRVDLSSGARVSSVPVQVDQPSAISSLGQDGAVVFGYSGAAATVRDQSVDYWKTGVSVTQAVTVGASIWVASDAGVIAQVDPAGSVIAETTIPGRTKIAVTGDMVYAVGTAPGQLYAIDATTGKTAASVEFDPGGPAPMEFIVAADTQHVWIEGGESGTLWTIDPATLRIVDTSASDGVRSMAAAAGELWAATGEDSLVEIAQD